MNVREKERRFKEEFYSTRNKLIAKGYGPRLARQLTENALISNYGRAFARRMLRTLEDKTCGDISA